MYLHTRPDRFHRRLLAHQPFKDKFCICISLYRHNPPYVITHGAICQRECQAGGGPGGTRVGLRLKAVKVKLGPQFEEIAQLSSHSSRSSQFRTENGHSPILGANGELTPGSTLSRHSTPKT